MMANNVPIHLVATDDRLRPADEAQVIALVESIRDVGVLNPITVHQRPVIHGNVFVPGYGLVAGLHRLVAAKRIGLKEIPAHIVTLSSLQRQIAECDENLCGPKLTTAERALFTRRRKEAYEALHPETRKGVAGGKARQGAATAKLSFAADTAKRTGQSERAVQRDAARAEVLGDDVLRQVKGTSLDNGAALDALADLPKPERAVAIDRAVKGEKVTGRDIEKPKKVETPLGAVMANSSDVEGQREQAYWVMIADMTCEQRTAHFASLPKPSPLEKALAAYDALPSEKRLAFHEQRPDPTEPNLAGLHNLTVSISEDA